MFIPKDGAYCRPCDKIDRKYETRIKFDKEKNGLYVIKAYDGKYRIYFSDLACVRPGFNDTFQISLCGRGVIVFEDETKIYRPFSDSENTKVSELINRYKQIPENNKNEELCEGEYILSDGSSRKILKHENKTIFITNSSYEEKKVLVFSKIKYGNDLEPTGYITDADGSLVQSPNNSFIMGCRNIIGYQKIEDSQKAELIKSAMQTFQQQSKKV